MFLDFSKLFYFEKFVLPTLRNYLKNEPLRLSVSAKFEGLRFNNILWYFRNVELHEMKSFIQIEDLNWIESRILFYPYKSSSPKANK